MDLNIPMSKRRSPFSEAVYLEWEPLAFPSKKLDKRERERRWEELYRRCFVNDAWTVSVFDAGLISALGVSIALSGKRWADAAKLCNQFLSHPEAGIDPISVDHHTARLGCATILMGDVEAGIRILLKPIEANSGEKSYVPDLRNLFHGGILGELGPKNSPDPRIAQFVSTVLLQFPNKKRAGKAALKASTNRELQDLLATTWR